MNNLHTILSIGQLLSLMVVCSIAAAQLPMPLMNPSFEDISIPGTTAESAGHEIVSSWVHWTQEKSTKENSPVLHRNDDVSKYVRQTAWNGDAYLELAVHENNTWQSIGQELYEPLISGKHYSLSLYKQNRFFQKWWTQSNRSTDSTCSVGQTTTKPPQGN
jgi:hypothetical protein